MDTVKAILDAIPDAAWWPILVFVVILFFRSNLRSALEAFTAVLNRARKVSFPGAGGIESGETPQQRVPSAPALDLASLKPAFSTPFLRERENETRAILARRQVTDPAQQVEVLLSHVVAQEVELVCERIDHTIWGSQIVILETANASIEPLPEARVIAPRQAWRILLGESPGRARASHPPVSSVAPTAESGGSSWRTK